jgi:Kef-type K+ transport system membrane component KefB
LISQDFVKFGLQVAAMLACALLFGQIFRKLNQPAVIGEMIGGIFLGPTIFGWFSPGVYEWLFQSSANVAAVREASIKMGMLFFLFAAGLEVNLAEVRRQRRKTASIGLIGTLVPIGIGIGLVYLLPKEFWGDTANNHFFPFALFVGMNLANSANPVIARILMELGLLKGEIGAVVMSSTVVDDLINWTLFAIILSYLAPSGAGNLIPLHVTIILLVLFVTVIMTIGRWLGSRALSFARSHVSWPSGFITLTALVILVSGSISEGIGLHAFLGAFLAGVALSGNGQEKNEAHQVIKNFVLSFFAPIYFVSIGMTTNFIQHFDFNLVLLLLVVACVGKIGSVLLGAKVAGMRIDKTTWAIVFGLNARGATGIILAGVGLANNLIDERLFVAMVVMALLTTLMSGPTMKALLPRSLPRIAAEVYNNKKTVSLESKR